MQNPMETKSSIMSNGVIRKQSNRMRMVVSKMIRPKDSKIQKIGVKQSLTMQKQHAAVARVAIYYELEIERTLTRRLDTPMGLSR